MASGLDLLGTHLCPVRSFHDVQPALQAQAAHAPPAAAAHHTGLTMTHTYASTPYDAHAGLVHLPAPGSVDFSSLGAKLAPPSSTAACGRADISLCRNPSLLVAHAPPACGAVRLLYEALCRPGILRHASLDGQSFVIIECLRALKSTSSLPPQASAQSCLHAGHDSPLLRLAVCGHPLLPQGP